MVAAERLAVPALPVPPARTAGTTSQLHRTNPRCHDAPKPRMSGATPPDAPNHTRIATDGSNRYTTGLQASLDSAERSDSDQPTATESAESRVAAIEHAEALATPEMTDAAAPTTEARGHEMTDAASPPTSGTRVAETDEHANPAQELETPDMIDATATQLAASRPSSWPT